MPEAYAIMIFDKDDKIVMPSIESLKRQQKVII